MMPEREILAQLNEDQLRALSALEDELGVTLVAYESPMHDNDNQIVESEV
ncbi:hypothetical protein MHZ92_04670 [Sporosarcina sp. ACRSL]|nr:hypothetical protein [Sporosarcina sp. ACRSL]MCG7343412.1 hypothetical protein [Sporosarcina sp. ACRSL]